MLSIPNLIGGGLVLGYRCAAKCRHCLYGCGPHRSDGKPRAKNELDKVISLLAKKAPRASYHIGGGEPFLDYPLLKDAIRLMREKGLRLDYVETNASWVTDRSGAVENLAKLRRVGLKCVLVSLSPFHAEYVPLFKTLTLIEAAQETLAGGAFVWMSHFINDLVPFSKDQVLDLDELLISEGPSYGANLAARYSLVPAGRAGRFIKDQGVHKPWQSLTKCSPCVGRLRDTSHFHVDCEGLYVPGLCGGLVLPLSEVPGEIELSKYPILKTLMEDGVGGLVELARQRDFVPDDFYSSPCDLCTHARLHLFRDNRESYPELGPKQFYEEASLPGFTRPLI